MTDKERRRYSQTLQELKKNRRRERNLKRTGATVPTVLFERRAELEDKLQKQDRRLQSK